jgi:hypothetical protein
MALNRKGLLVGGWHWEPGPMQRSWRGMQNTGEGGALFSPLGTSSRQSPAKDRSTECLTMATCIASWVVWRASWVPGHGKVDGVLRLNGCSIPALSECSTRWSMAYPGCQRVLQLPRGAGKSDASLWFSVRGMPSMAAGPSDAVSVTGLNGHATDALPICIYLNPKMHILTCNDLLTSVAVHVDGSSNLWEPAGWKHH